MMSGSRHLRMVMESVAQLNVTLGAADAPPEYDLMPCDRDCSAATATPPPLLAQDHHHHHHHPHHPHHPNAPHYPLSEQLGDSTKLVGVQVALILAYSAIILFGVAGNALVIYVVYRFRTLRTVTNFFIVNLAVSDLFMNTLCLPFTLVYTLHGEWKFGRALCFVLPCAQATAVHVSTITLSVIALDRHHSIVRHRETYKMSKDTCAAVITATWAAGAVLASPLAIFREYGTLDISPGTTIEVCAEEWPGGRSHDATMDGTVYSIAILLVQYVLPLAVNSFAYVHIWSTLKKKLVAVGPEGRGNPHDHHRRRRKTTKMLVTVVAVFAVAWLPFHAFQLAIDIDSSVLDMKDFKLLFTVFHVVAMCSTCVNPILYGWMNNKYRDAFRTVCTCDTWWRGSLSRSRRTAVSRPVPREAAVSSNFKSTHV